MTDYVEPDERPEEPKILPIVGSVEDYVAGIMWWLNEAHEQIRHLEKENRKLNDKLNRYRNVLPGRKRLITLGRIAAHAEYVADELEQTLDLIDSEHILPENQSVMDYSRKRLAEDREDILFLRRLEWDFEQAIDVVWEPKQPRHVWPRP